MNGKNKTRNEGLKSLLIGLVIIFLTYAMYKVLKRIGFNWEYFGIYAIFGLVAYLILGLYNKTKKDE